MSRLLAFLKHVIGVAYWHLCHPVLQRREYFTPQLTRLMMAWGIFWWFAMFGLAGLCFYHLFHEPSFWEAALDWSTLFFLCWLSDHLNDFSRAHPENVVEPDDE